MHLAQATIQREKLTAIIKQSCMLHKSVLGQLIPKTFTEIIDLGQSLVFQVRRAKIINFAIWGIYSKSNPFKQNQLPIPIFQG